MGEFTKALMRDEADRAGCDRLQVMVHDLKVQALQIGNVTGRVEREDLPFTLRGQLVAAGEALDEKTALGWPIPLTDDVLIRADLFDRKRQTEDALSFVLGDGADAPKLSDENINLCAWVRRWAHGRLRLKNGTGYARACAPR